MFKVFPVEKSDGLWYGIENEGGILYEDNFDTQEEAQKFADAHNNGARSYWEAHAMIYGLGDEAAQQSVHPTAEGACIHGYAEGNCIHSTCINHPSFGGG